MERKTLHQGTADAKSGSEKLNDGIQDLNDGAQKLQTGSTKLLDGQEALADGAKGLTSGSQNLYSGMKQLSDGHDSLENGMNEVSKGVKNWSAGNAQLMQGQEQAADTANTLKKQLDAYMKSHPDAIKDQDFKQIVALSVGLSEAATTLHAGQKQLGEGAAKVADGQEAVQTGMNTFGDKMAQATSGAKQLNEGSEELANGLFQMEKWFLHFTCRNRFASRRKQPASQWIDGTPRRTGFTGNGFKQVIHQA